MSKKFVIDTNVLLSDPQAILKFEDSDIVVPQTVLEELDNQKSSDRDIARDARAAIRQLEELIGDGDPILKGVSLPTGGKLFVSPNVDYNSIPFGIKPTCNDDHIINVAGYTQEILKEEVVLVSNDICMRLKAKGIGLNHVQEFNGDGIVRDPNTLPKGYLLIPDNWLESLPKGSVLSKSCGETHIAASCIQDLLDSFSEEDDEVLGINDWLINEADGIAARFDDISEDEKFFIFTFMNVENQLLRRKAAGISPRDIFQGVALDAILDTDIDIVILDADAGSGKTLLGLAGAVEMIDGKKSYRMDELILTRSNDTQFKEIGFLKGGESSKMAPWLQGCLDNLEVIARESKKIKYHPKNSVALDESSSDDAFISLKNMGFMRGRSINHKVLFLEEVQNLTASQMKTVLTRAGEYCKVILTGNLGQIDNDYLSPRTSGLTYAVEKLHGQNFAKIIRLRGGHRSQLSAFVEENF